MYADQITEAVPKLFDLLSQGSGWVVDPETDRQVWGATARLATRRQLTLCDAAYSELALRRGLPLATRDKDLRRAAKGENVELLGVWIGD